MAQTILIAEDDGDIADLLTLYLTGEGYRVLAAPDGRQVLALLEGQKVDLAILDIMLPEIGGYDLLRRIRQRWNLPVLILSAKAQDADRILGLNLGADAYLTKPFHPLEVVAYVKAALRRYCQLGGEEGGGEEALPLFTAGDLELDPLAMVLRKRGEEVPLTPHGVEDPGQAHGRSRAGVHQGPALRHRRRGTLERREHHDGPHLQPPGQGGGRPRPAPVHQDRPGSGVQV